MEQSKSLIKTMENAIRYQAVPLYEMVRDMSHRRNCPGYVRECVRQIGRGLPFPEAWEKSMQEQECKAMLKKEDVSLLSAFGQGLGASDIEGQISHCKLYFSMLDEKYQNAKEEFEKKGKLYFMLGVLSGIGIALVLV